jgi:hypothetical protein
MPYIIRLSTSNFMIRSVLCDKTSSLRFDDHRHCSLHPTTHIRRASANLRQTKLRICCTGSLEITNNNLHYRKEQRGISQVQKTYFATGTRMVFRAFIPQCFSMYLTVRLGFQIVPVEGYKCVTRFKRQDVRTGGAAIYEKNNATTMATRHLLMKLDKEHDEGVV